MVERPIRHHLAQASHPDLICLCQQPHPRDQAHTQQQGRARGYKSGAMNMGGGHEPGGGGCLGLPLLPGTPSTWSEGWDRQKGPFFSSPLLTRPWPLLQRGSLPCSVYPEAPLKSSNTRTFRLHSARLLPWIHMGGSSPSPREAEQVPQGCGGVVSTGELLL